MTSNITPWGLYGAFICEVTPFFSERLVDLYLMGPIFEGAYTRGVTVQRFTRKRISLLGAGCKKDPAKKKLAAHNVSHFGLPSLWFYLLFGPKSKYSFAKISLRKLLMNFWFERTCSSYQFFYDVIHNRPFVKSANPWASKIPELFKRLWDKSNFFRWSLLLYEEKASTGRFWIKFFRRERSWRFSKDSSPIWWTLSIWLSFKSSETIEQENPREFSAFYTTREHLY